MLHSRDFDTPTLDELELRHFYEQALSRSTRLRVRRTRRQVAWGTVPLACILLVGLLAASFATTTRRTVVAGTAWRLVSDVSAANSSWQELSGSGYQQTFSLVCPSETTCYAYSLGGQLEYTDDGGATWQQAAGIGTTMSSPQISCAAAQDCDILAQVSSSGSTLYTTTDGGLSWTSQPGPALPPSSPEGPPGGPSFWAMSCSTISWCLVISPGTSSDSFTSVFTTSDGGTTWSQSTFPSAGSAEFVPSGGLSCSGSSCVTVGFYGVWQSSRALSASQSGNVAVKQGFNPHGGGFVAYTSDDGGVMWTASTPPPNGQWYATSLTCPDSDDCYATAFPSTALYETHDGGQTWGQVSTAELAGPSESGATWSFNSMSCASASSCWLAASAMPPAPQPATNSAIHEQVSIGQMEGLLASTTDGGSTWASSTLPAGVGGVIDVTCPSTSTCYALGVEQTGPAPGDSEIVLLTNAS